ncbi:putative iron-regulated membrane protein [Novosphingobium sp. PhB165]|uniref:PepSY-associated TM helix domain-containing protein n=1 Tax=Novosphingobium sp. PhB165 TaxID=2485105 RepID=UPI001043F78A|nr:PepSY-associated TM helix domain-containing protein [Novosphingobium sp. PhB165]TCM16581.1 putative iron-regulated membrane protein [Novosphingobium sp. PhB165]
MTLLKIHRWIALVAVIFTLYLAVTGTLLQLIDLTGILGHASPYNANMQAMRGDPNGPGDYAMIGPADYLAPRLPADADVPALLATTAQAARAAAGATPIRSLDLRMRDGQVIGIAQLNDQLPPLPGSEGPPMPRHTILVFDAVSGKPLPTGEIPQHNVERQDSLRVIVKSLHRLTTFGNNALWINVFVGVGLAVLIVTGVWVHIKQYRARAKMGRKAFLWKAQDWWRTLHRAFSVICALFLTVLVASGLWLAVESLVFGYYMSDQIAQAMATHRPPPMFADHFSPLKDGEAYALANTTMGAYAADRPGIPPRAVRLRVFAGYTQGVIVSGDAGDQSAQQFVYNARTGETMRETEPGYPEVGFPFGWQAHQWAKSVHNGSLIGLTGRGIGLLAGLCMFYLSISGIVMYVRMWRRRAANGKRQFFW